MFLTILQRPEVSKFVDNRGIYSSRKISISVAGMWYSHSALTELGSEERSICKALLGTLWYLWLLIGELHKFTDMCCYEVNVISKSVIVSALGGGRVMKFCPHEYINAVLWDGSDVPDMGL